MSTSSITVDGVCADLAEEQEDLDRIVGALDDAALDTPTPAQGWTVRDQVTHLAFFDGRGTMAIVDPEAFVAEVRRF
ncbi:MAG TPA: maleylpyruvate isomerase N-terminal domain-containing protein, partial [Candidatus Dormibacteraeota bacterium]|nr:maleylpyruvate isomerase N-terminal domain-containing protein [Candidatus Dormibacteraeota bacterium]